VAYVSSTHADKRSSHRVVNFTFKASTLTKSNKKSAFFAVACNTLTQGLMVSKQSTH
jgi:hypothetical protein